MNRRQLVSSLGAVAIMGPRRSGPAIARPAEAHRLMMAIAENDPEGLRRVEAFRRSLEEAGWVDGRDVAIDVAWYRGSFQMAQTAAKDYVDRRSTSSSSTARRAWTRCARSARACPSCSSSLAIRSAQATCPTCRGPAPTSPASARSSRDRRQVAATAHGRWRPV